MTESFYVLGYNNNKTGKVTILNDSFSDVKKDSIYSHLIKPVLNMENYENFAYDIELKKGITRISKTLELDCVVLEDNEVQILLSSIKTDKGYVYNTTVKKLIYTFFLKKLNEKSLLPQDDTKSVFEELTLENQNPSELKIEKQKSIEIDIKPLLTFKEELESKVKDYPLLVMPEIKEYKITETEFQKELHEAVQKRRSVARTRELKRRNKKNLKIKV